MKRTYFNSLFALGRLWVLIYDVIGDLAAAIRQSCLKSLRYVMAACVTKDVYR